MKEWKTNGGTYTIEDILSEIRKAEKEGQNVCSIPWVLRLKDVTIDDILSKLQEMKKQGKRSISTLDIISLEPLSVFKDATIIEGWNVPKFDVLVTQEGKSVALKHLGQHKENHDLYYMLAWISDYDPKKGDPPCAGKMLYLFEPEDQNLREIVPKSE